MPVDVPEINPNVPAAPTQNSTFNDILLNIIQLIPTMGPIVIDKVFSSTEEDLLYLLQKKLEAYLTAGVAEQSADFVLAPAAQHTETFVLPADLTANGHGIVHVTLMAIGAVTGKVYGYKRSSHFIYDGLGFSFGSVSFDYDTYYTFAAPAITTAIFGDNAAGYRWRFTNDAAENLQVRVSYKIYHLPQ